MSQPLVDGISIAAAASHLGVTEQTVRRRIADGSLRAYRLGPKLLRVSRAEVDAMLRPVPTVASATSAA